uniref:Uncharacterized protein n=1 Tax=Anguilla anguilla TaxID=7936 RepID=A0A0E9PD56_ANGAN
MTQVGLSYSLLGICGTLCVI